MKATDYFKVIRRRWPVIIACALAAGLVMWIITPAKPPPVERVTSYDATATLIINGPAGTQDSPAPSVSLDRMALYITTGEIPQRVAAKLGDTREPALLASRLQVTPNSSSMSMTLSMSGSNGQLVADTVNAFAQEAVDYFGSSRDATGRATVSILQEATPIPVIASGGFTIPPSRSLRTTLAALLGLLIGFGLALVLHQVDSRLRTRDEIYEALRMPVVAEIPKLSRTQRESARILVADQPHGTYADGYRTARAAIMHTRSRSLMNDDAVRTAETAQVVLVTSAQSGEGKTTSIANLAASFAETGQSVLVLDADLRSPDLHLRFDVPQGAGISDFLYDPASTRLSALARPTSVPGVKIITAGTQLAHPASLATRMGTLIDEARDVADVILVDTAPLLAASDVFDLLPIVDTVLFVVRSGRLTESAAQRVSEFLGRFHVPVTGAVLVGVPTRRSDGYGYGYGSAAEDPAAGKRAARKKRRITSSPPSAAPSQQRDLEAPGRAQDYAVTTEEGMDTFDPYAGYEEERDLPRNDWTSVGSDEAENPRVETRRQRRAAAD